ncbi:hypothetical protein BZZ01_10085 [Nostocales cyanobacterium HT-58-2]|nr:hypothetical protein BZZ01_10085 [Nostocales cyanobacterium HT-58-2]
MAILTISDLHPTDNEKLLDALTDMETKVIVGGVSANGGISLKLRNLSPYQLQFFRIATALSDPDRGPLTLRF